MSAVFPPQLPSLALGSLFGVGAAVLGNVVTVIPQGQFAPQNGDPAIDIQATLEEVMTDLVTVTDHPVEFGAQISDHAFNQPVQLIMRCGWSNSVSSYSKTAASIASLFSNSGSSNFAGLSSLGIGGASPIPVSGGSMAVSDYVSNVYSQLLALQQSLTPFSVVTSIRQYTNMMMTTLSVTRDHKTSQALMVTAQMRQVIIVNTVSVTLAPIANMATPANTAETIAQGPPSPVVTTPSPGGSPGAAVWPPGSDEAMGIFN